MKKNLKTRLTALFVTSLGLVTAGSALAAAPTTITELASGVDFSDVGMSILGVAGTLLSVYVLWFGARFVLKAVRSA